MIKAQLIYFSAPTGAAASAGGERQQRAISTGYRRAVRNTKLGSTIWFSRLDSNKDINSVLSLTESGKIHLCAEHRDSNCLLGGCWLAVL